MCTTISTSNVTSSIDRLSRNYAPPPWRSGNRSPASVAPQISRLYEDHKADAEGYVDVDVKTAYSFTKEEQKKFASTLEKTLAKKVRMNVSVDKSLIGGFLAKAGDRVIDGSVKGRLQHMQKTLKA